jgi:hypothetical protein
MRAVDQWREIEAGLGARWTTATLGFVPEGESADAAAVLVPLRPGRVGNELRVTLDRALGDATRLAGLLERLDRKRIWGTLALVDVVAPAPEADAVERAESIGLAQAWEEAVSTLPPDWSDALLELELDSSDWLPRAALLGAPLNPSRVQGCIALRFRASGKQGYGTSPAMVHRCLERMDAEGITGRISVVFGLSDAGSTVTQGPVWRIAGRSV